MFSRTADAAFRWTRRRLRVARMWSMPRPVLQLVAAALAICAIGSFAVGFLNVPGRGRLPGEAAAGEAGLNNAAEVRPLNADEFLTPQPPEPEKDEPEEAEAEEVAETPVNQAAALPAPKILAPKLLEPPPAPEPAPPQPAAPEDPPF